MTNEAFRSYDKSTQLKGRGIRVKVLGKLVFSRRILVENVPDYYSG